jgi:hypothetical protein
MSQEPEHPQAHRRKRPCWTYIRVEPTAEPPQVQGRKRLSARQRYRWRTAIHEAGHVVIACVTTGKFLAGAQILFADCGCAYLPEQHDDFLCAVAVAAGRAAEVLAERHDPPAVPRSAGKPSPKLRTRAIHDGLKSDRRASIPDTVVLARWAIAHVEDEPGRWESRLRWVYRTAEDLVAHHEASILAVAALLYSRGIVLSADVARILGRTEQPKEE